MPAILERYRDRIEATIKPYLELKLIPDQNLTWWQSKFAGWQNSQAGFPYLPKGVDYPKSPDGNYLHLLAQINFAEVPHLEGFPKQGILQFYIADDEYCGLNENHFRILYHRQLDFNENHLTTDFSFLPEKDDHRHLREIYPNECSAIQWTKGYEPISQDNYDFYPRLLPELFNDEEIEDEIHVDDLREEFDEACGWRFQGANCDIQMGGYTSFVNDDPRDYLDSNEDAFDTLLLMIRLVENGSLYFYIQSSALARCDFSRILCATA